MKKNERVLYMLIITIQFLIIAYYAVNLMYIREKIKQTGIIFKTKKNIEYLKSFSGLNRKNQKEFIQFSNLNSKFYVITFISSDCHYCCEFVEKLNDYCITNEINKNIEIIYISDNEYKKKYLIEDFKFLIVKTSLEQFGNMVPMMFVVDNKGKILYKTGKPDKRVFDYVFQFILK